MDDTTNQQQPADMAAMPAAPMQDMAAPAAPSLSDLASLTPPPAPVAPSAPAQPAAPMGDKAEATDEYSYAEDILNEILDSLDRIEAKLDAMEKKQG